MKLETNARVGDMATRCTAFFFILVLRTRTINSYFFSIDFEPYCVVVKFIQKLL